MMADRFMVFIGIGLMLVVQFGCIGLKTFPYTAQAGDTVTIGGGLDLGGSNEYMNRTNTKLELRKVLALGNPPTIDPSFPTRDITANIRSIFQLYPDPRSPIWNYNMFLGPLTEGRPYQTGLALDLPSDLWPGFYQLIVSSSVTFNDWTPFVRIIDDPNTMGAPSCFQDQSAYCNNITALERQKYVRMKFRALPDMFGQNKLVPCNILYFVY